MSDGLYPDDPIAQLQEVRKQTPAPAKIDTNGHAPRPTIRITVGELAQVVDEVDVALGGHSANLYSYGNKLVQIVTGEIRTTQGKEKSLRLALVTPHNLLYQISMAAKFEKYNPKIEQWINADCPRQVAETYIALGQWRLPTLLDCDLSDIAAQWVLSTPGTMSKLDCSSMTAASPSLPFRNGQPTRRSPRRGTQGANRKVQIRQRKATGRAFVHHGRDTARAGYRPRIVLTLRSPAAENPFSAISPRLSLPGIGPPSSGPITARN
jgi:hypothetical protein